MYRFSLQTDLTHLNGKQPSSFADNILPPPPLVGRKETHSCRQWPLFLLREQWLGNPKHAARGCSLERGKLKVDAEVSHWTNTSRESVKGVLDLHLRTWGTNCNGRSPGSSKMIPLKFAISVLGFYLAGTVAWPANQTSLMQALLHGTRQ